MISSFNEWDQLQEVVVGSIEHANWPSNDPVFSKESEKTTWTKTPVPSGPVPKWIIEQTKIDLEKLELTLKSLGVNVHRPKEINFVEREGMYNYCPRDRLIVYGDTIIDPAMMYPCRDMEIEALDYVIYHADEVLRMPRDEGMVLDAANVLRLNDTILYLESASGNDSAYAWLKAVMTQRYPDLKFEKCNFYSGVHIDSTICPIREGLVVLNGSRVNENNCPKVFEKWEKIWVDDVREQGFHEYPYASKWIALNMLVINPKTVIIDARQLDLMKTLEAYGIECIPLTLRHSRTLGGGFHCVTLDLLRSNK